MSKRLPGAALAAAMAGVVGGALFGAYRREIGEIRRRVKEAGRIAETAKGPIEYAVAGSGPSALVIHGAGGGYDQGLLIATSFDQFQVIAPSRFGYLGTPVPEDGSPAAQADAHSALLDSLGVGSVIVAAASAGAPSALELALRHPERVRALILLVPRGYSPDRPVEVPATLSNRQVLRVMLSGADFAYWAALRIARSRIVQFMGVPPEVEAHAPAAERERVGAIMQSVLPLSRRVAGIRNDSSTVIGPMPFERIAVPTLIITAWDDLFGTLPAAEYMADRIPGAKLIVLESGGHLFVGRQHEVNGAIAHFLDQTAAAERNVRLFRLRA